MALALPIMAPVHTTTARAIDLHRPRLTARKAATEPLSLGWETGPGLFLPKILVVYQMASRGLAAILGTGGDEAIHGILDMMYAKAPYSTLRRAMHIHSTVSELIPTILGELQPLV